jgi:prophage tail gpP-like protein
MELIINDRIRNRKVEFFNSINISLRYNAIASPFSLDFYYDPDVQEQKDMACIGHYHICQLLHNGELLLTGYILSEAFTDSQVKHLVSIGGYSLPGVLDNCNVPTNESIDTAIQAGNLKLSKNTPTKPYAYPLQDNGLNLREIAQKYLAAFNLQMVIDPLVSKAMEDTFIETTIKPKDSIKQYLTELCTQKNINLTHDKFGRVVFTKVRTDLKPILSFDVPKGGIPGIKMDLQFNGENMHSQITVVKQADIDDDNAGEATVTNPFVPYVFRPRTIIQNSGENIDSELAAKNALAEELRNLSIVITIDRWDINQKIITPNNIISVTNPEIYLFKKTNLFIEAIDYKGDQKELTAVLHCCLPEAYNGQTPNYIFKGINTH